ncbi:unnamed protein product [Heterobilharzia americana]|nr:unnamed protein product [Heterobilharzia americana]
MLSKSKIEAHNLKHPPFQPSSSSLVKQSKKMIKRSVTFEHGTNSNVWFTSSSSSPSYSSSLPFTSTSQCYTNRCNKQTFTFSYLLRNNPPLLPGDILNYFNFTKSPSTTMSPVISRSSINSNFTGKVKVIVCVNKTHDNSSSQGLAMIASTAMKTVGDLLSTSHPLSTIHPKSDRNSSSASTSPSASYSLVNCLQIDHYRKAITLLDPTPSRRRGGGLPKMYKFDNIVTQDTLTPKFCSMVLSDAITAVLNGQDSCIITIGHKATGKTHSMIGYDYSPTECGIIPCAISWLYQLLNYQKRVYNTRFSIRISAVEISGPNEEFHDLLANTSVSCDEEYSDKSPSHYLQTPNTIYQNKASLSPPLLPNGKVGSFTATTAATTNTVSTRTTITTHYEKTQSISAKMVEKLSNLCELRASSSEKAAHLLDTALSNRSVHRCDRLSGLSHMLFTLHLYQCKLENNSNEMSISGGRTKFHFLDLGCGRYGQHSLSMDKCTDIDNSSKVNSKLRFPTKNDMKENSSGATTMDDANLTRLSTKDSETTSSPSIHNIEVNENRTISKALSLSGIGSVLLALLTGRRQLPFRDSSLTYLLREAITGNQIQPCILAHVSGNAQYYTETLQVIQLATEINRLRRRKIGVNHSGTLTKDTGQLGSNSDKSQDDTGSSSMDTENGPMKIHRSYLRRPRLGRLSYARSLGSCSSELDCTSSGEQSCDTVIYVGNKNLLQSVHRYSDSHLSSHSISELGPKGLSDDSVDVNDIAHSQRGSSESMTMNDEKLRKKNQINYPVNGSTIVKRMIPRTNATAWPRVVSVRRSKKLLQSTSTSSSSTMTTTEETWIDGPNVALKTLPRTTATSMTMVTTTETITSKENVANNHHETVLMHNSQSVSKNETSCSPALSPLPAPPSYHNHVHNLIKDTSTTTTTTTSFISNTEEMCKQITEEPIINSIQTQTLVPDTTNIFVNKSISEPIHHLSTENNFSSSSSSTCSTLESNQSRKAPRALSDISERTEEAETIQESNSSKQLNLSLSQECLTSSLFTTSQLFPFDNTFYSNQLLIKENQKLESIDNHNSNPSTLDTSTKPTEVLLDIGRQIREASKCNNYAIPTSYVSVNVPQYLNCLNEDDELISNLKNTKSPSFNCSMVNEVVYTSSSSLSNDNQTDCLSRSLSVTSSHQLQSHNCTKMKYQHSLRSRTQPSKMNKTGKSIDILTLLQNNNTTATTITATTTTSSTSNHYTNTSCTANSSLFRVAEWVSSINPPCSYQSDQHSSMFNCSTYKNETDHNDNVNKNNNNNDNSLHYCINSTLITNNPIKSYLNKDKNNSNHSVYSMTAKTTTSSTFNDSAIGSSKYTKQNNSLLNSNYTSRLCEQLESKQSFPLYSSSPVVPPPSLLSINNDTNPHIYPYYSTRSDDICQIPQSYSTPIFLSSQEMSAYSNNTNDNNTNHFNNLHPSYNYLSKSPSFNSSEVFPMKFIEEPNLLNRTTYEIDGNIEHSHGNYHSPNHNVNVAYHSNYSSQIGCNHSIETTPKQAFYASTYQYSIKESQHDRSIQVHLDNTEKNLNKLNNINHDINVKQFINIPLNCYHNNEDVNKQIEKSKMKLSLKFLTLPLFRNFRLRRKDKKSNFNKVKKDTNDSIMKKEQKLLLHNNNDQCRNDELMKSPSILHSLSLPVKLTTFGHKSPECNVKSVQPNTDNNNNNNNNHCYHCCHLHHSHQNQYSYPTVSVPQSSIVLQGHHTPSPHLPTTNIHHPMYHEYKQFDQHLWNQYSENTQIKPNHNQHLNQCIPLQNQYIHYNELVSTQNESFQHKNEISSGLRNSASTGFTTISGKLPASINRSTRRSVHIGSGGGPSSSGYESMRTGVSELSLSHQDSASDCSGQFKEIFSRRSSLDGYRHRCSNQHYHYHDQRQHCQQSTTHSHKQTNITIK